MAESKNEIDNLYAMFLNVTWCEILENDRSITVPPITFVPIKSCLLYFLRLKAKIRYIWKTLQLQKLKGQ